MSEVTIGVTAGVKHADKLGDVLGYKIFAGASIEAGVARTRDVLTGKEENEPVRKAQMGIEIRITIGKKIDWGFRIGPSSEEAGLVSVGSNPDKDGLIKASHTLPPTGPVGVQGTFGINPGSAVRALGLKVPYVAP